MVLKGKKDSCDFVELYLSQNHSYNENLELDTKSKKMRIRQLLSWK